MVSPFVTNLAVTAIRERPVPYLVENEKTKLLAGALDRLSTGLFVIGVLGPYAAIIYGTSTPLSDDSFLISIFSWFAGGVIIHNLAQWVLESLREWNHMNLQSFVLFVLPFVIAAGASVVSVIHVYRRHRRQLRIEENEGQKEAAKLPG